MELLSFMAAPLVATLLMGGILVYFGIHVIKREIVFIDIALAQIAALGGTFAIVLFPHDHEGHSHEGGDFITEYLFALLFTTLAAGLFSILKNKKVKIPLEALIGISYAVATTAMVIILDKGAGSDVHIHDMLTGAILWVSWDQILRLAIIVSVVALIHVLLRKQMIRLTDNYVANEKTIKRKRLLDFLFYFSFGLVIVEAVQIGGILTVFALLIIPASTTLLFFSNWRARILAGLLLIVLLTIPALALSWTWDVPASPVLIFFLGITLLISGLVYQLKKR
ncbi:MAG: metal ABC transporter permease [Bacteroidetes bacterium]|jgi:zinc/manganese transport system permease protein|nr:metal ABC transporter permease [Bacteroidota bacterium]MBT3748628.1 metal ABC transporter permease [Bacteroidota bacterium]MBT4399813.1 metal ABC transporter permease [Bacteroidota bacterium]MBT4410284.1 metal ABC transporter permease [Bacteroidota bacterium]MBT5426538.1 metal ABC transporter permease [Bacteroidota bacterium]